MVALLGVFGAEQTRLLYVELCCQRTAITGLSDAEYSHVIFEVGTAHVVGWEHASRVIENIDGKTRHSPALAIYTTDSYHLPT